MSHPLQGRSIQIPSTSTAQFNYSEVISGSIANDRMDKILMHKEHTYPSIYVVSLMGLHVPSIC